MSEKHADVAILRREVDDHRLAGHDRAGAGTVPGRRLRPAGHGELAQRGAIGLGRGTDDRPQLLNRQAHAHRRPRRLQPRLGGGRGAPDPRELGRASSRAGARRSAPRRPPARSQPRAGTRPSPAGTSPAPAHALTPISRHARSRISSSASRLGTPSPISFISPRSAMMSSWRSSGRACAIGRRVEGRDGGERDSIRLPVEERIDHPRGDLVPQLGRADRVGVDQDVSHADGGHGPSGLPISQ